MGHFSSPARYRIGFDICRLLDILKYCKKQIKFVMFKNRICKRLTLSHLIYFVSTTTGLPK